jgi:hypothetical protein
VTPIGEETRCHRTHRTLEIARVSTMKAGDLNVLTIVWDDELIYVHPDPGVDDKEECHDPYGGAR